MKPPIRGPSAVPRNAVYITKVTETALFFARNRSADVPPTTGRLAPPKNPAKNLRTQRVVILGENPAPRLNNATSGGVILYAPIRPKISLIGALSIGAKAKPSV